MAVENVVIKITTTASTRSVRQARNDLLKLAASGKLGSTTVGDLQKKFDQFDRRLKVFKKTANGVIKMLTTLNKVAIKLFTIGFAVGAAALAANNALFAAGRWLVKGYTVAMQGLAVAVAAVGAAATAAAAAFSEYTAAVNAYAFKTSTSLTGRLSESSAALRNLESDATLATFGVQALAGAFAAISKNAQVTGTSKQLLKGLADFAAAGGDPARNLAAAGEFIGLLQKAGKLDSKAIAAAEGLGPTFVEALKKARAQGISTLSEFSKFLSSGELAKLGGVEGQAGIVGQTLFGQFKAFLVQLKVVASDFGQILLGPVKRALDSISQIIRRTFSRVGPEMAAFGKGPALKALVRMFEILDNFAINLFRKYLPGANGMMARFADFWNKTVYFIKDVVKRLQSLLPGGRAVMEAFGKPFVEVFKTVGTWIRYIGDTIRRNQAQYNEFGQALLSFILKIQEVGKIFIDNFTEALPFLSRIVGWVEGLIDRVMELADAIGFVASGFERVINMLGGMGDGLGGFGKVAGFTLLLSLLRYKVGSMLGMPMSTMAYVGQAAAGGAQKAGRAGSSAFQRANQRAQLAAGNFYYNGFIPGAPSPVVGGQQARQLGRFARMSNAYRGARRGGAGFGGRVRAANTARMRYNAQMAPGTGFLSGMGPAASMFAASMFAAPEAQSSLQQGAMIASLAPMLGAAGPAAALAGVGYAGYGIMKNARTGGGGALGGAMTGAAVGAAIGTVIPVIGTAVGAIIGAIGGAVVGFVKGRANGEKLKVEKAVSEYTNDMLTNMAVGMIKGDTTDVRGQIAAFKERAKVLSDINEEYFQGGSKHERGNRKKTAEQLYAEGKISQSEMEAFINAPGTFAEQMVESAENLDKYLTPGLKKFDAASGLAANSLGMTTDELVALARAQGVDLFDQTTTLRDKFIELGLAMNYTSEQIVGAMRDIAIAGVETMMTRIERNLSAPRIDEITEGLYNDFISGATIGQDQLGQYVMDILDQLNIMTPDSPLTNIGTLVRLLGPNGTLFQAGMQLEGMGDVFAGVSQMLAGVGNQTQADAAAQLTDMIVKQGIFGGVAINRDQLSEQLGGMSLQELDLVQKALANGMLSPELLAGISSPTSRYMLEGATAGVEKNLARVGLAGVGFERLDPSAMTPDQMLLAYGEEGMAIINGMKMAMESTFENKPDWYKDAPEWFSLESFKSMLDPNGDGYIGDDTRTPRGDTTSRRLGKTLRRHDYFNSMFAGKRMMTSSYRTNNLGSINSDHITGKAYDLTGDNLGAYATMVNRTGGFAEFHGRGGGRHLHVVPGETPIGDDTTPYMGSVPASTTSNNSTNYYNISVQGTPGMDVNQLADAVMSRIQRIERSNRERS